MYHYRYCPSTDDSHSLCQIHNADFIADHYSLFEGKTLDSRIFVAHDGLAFFDPRMAVAMYDLRQYEHPPGNASLFRWDTRRQDSTDHYLTCPSWCLGGLLSGGPSLFRRDAT